MWKRVESSGLVGIAEGREDLNCFDLCVWVLGNTYEVQVNGIVFTMTLSLQIYRITGKFGKYYIWRMSHLNVIGGFQFGVSGVDTTALTLLPPENFNLAINGQIRQIANLKLPPN